MQDDTRYREPDSLFEHFIIVGLHSDTNLKPVEDAFAQRKMWDLEMAKPGYKDYKTLQKRWPKIPALEPQVECGLVAIFLCSFLFRGGGWVSLMHIFSGLEVLIASICMVPFER